MQIGDPGLNSSEGSPLSSAGESSVRDPERTDTQVQNVVKILGLRFGTKYTAENIKTLRYGHLMIMTDQDHDGSWKRRPVAATTSSPSQAGPTSRAY